MYKGHLEVITNRQTWSDTFTCLTAPGVPLNIATALFELYVRDPKTKCVLLTAKTTDGVHFTLPNGGTDGVVKWTFTDVEVHKLCALTYDVALYIIVAGVVTPLALVSLPVLEGIRP